MTAKVLEFLRAVPAPAIEPELTDGELFERAQEIIRQAREFHDDALTVFAGVAGVYELNISLQARIVELETELVQCREGLNHVRT